MVVSIPTPSRALVWASSITSRLVAAVCNSNSKLDTREVKKLKGISEKIAIPSHKHLRVRVFLMNFSQYGG